MPAIHDTDSSRPAAGPQEAPHFPEPLQLHRTLIIIIPITPTAEVIININPDIQKSHQLNIKYTILMENIFVNCVPDAMGADRAELYKRPNPLST